MKKEIKSIGAVSMGKTTIYMMIIPVALMLVIGFFALLIGILIGESQVAIFGGMYMILPLFMIVLYAAGSMLVALIYNWLAGKFGGLEITFVDIPSDATDVNAVIVHETNSTDVDQPNQ